MQVRRVSHDWKLSLNPVRLRETPCCLVSFGRSRETKPRNDKVGPAFVSVREILPRTTTTSSKRPRVGFLIPLTPVERTKKRGSDVSDP